MIKRFKSYCSSCRKETGRFITLKESYRHSGRCLQCQIEKIGEILNSVNPAIGGPVRRSKARIKTGA